MVRLITVRKALKLEQLRGCTLVAGHEGIDRKITCVDTMEIPDIYSWLKKGELLLTTAYTIKNDEKALVRLIETLSRAEAAALAIKTRFIGGVSESARQCADRLDLPLIVMPEEMPFIDISNALIAVIVDEQNLRLDFSNSIHEKFMRLELEGGGIEQITAMLHRLLDRPVLITDDALERLAGSPDLQAYSALLRAEEGEFLLNADAVGMTRPLRKNEVLAARKVYYKGRIRGYILMRSPQEDMDDLTSIVLDHAATAVALEFSREDALRQQMDMLHNSLFIDLVMDKVGSEEQAAIRANQLRWITPPFSFMVFGIDLAPDCELHRSREVASAIGRLLARREITGSVIPGLESYHCLLNCRDKQALLDAAAATRDSILSIFGIRMSVGLVLSIGSYLGLAAAHKDASDALKIGRATGNNVVCIDDVRLEQAVLHTGDNPYLRSFVLNTAGRLIEYDKEHGTELVRTARTLVQHMGVRTQTAETLYLHRNTLLQRIRKIEAITGCDLSRSLSLQDLGLALRFAALV